LQINALRLYFHLCRKKKKAAIMKCATLTAEIVYYLRSSERNKEHGSSDENK